MQGKMQRGRRPQTRVGIKATKVHRFLGREWHLSSPGKGFINLIKIELYGNLD
jgi:hypothetical protein